MLYETGTRLFPNGPGLRSGTDFLTGLGAGDELEAAAATWNGVDGVSTSQLLTHKLQPAWVEGESPRRLHVAVDFLGKAIITGAT